MLRPTSLEAALPVSSSKDAEPAIVETEPLPPKGEFEGWEVGEEDLT